MLGRLRTFPNAVFVIVWTSALLLGGLTARSTAQAPGRYHRARPMVTGNGLNTGTASFQGNFTAMETPTGALALFREPNCSLDLATATYTVNSAGLTYSQTGLTPGYEQVLHHEAGLTTTPDVFAKGCASEAPLGIGSDTGFFVGTTTTGINVFAYVGPTYPNAVNGIYILSGSISFTLTSFQDSSASQVTAADLNKDGNGDLVISDSPLASSGYVTVMLGNPDGTFQNGVNYPIAGDYSVAADIDDVNGDGIPDIVAVSGDQQISVLLGKGDGTFGPATSFTAPLPPGYSSAPITNLITADLRGIGKRDVITSTGLVFLGNGDGTFTAVSTPAFPFVFDSLSSQGPFVASGDVNNDGKVDLVVSDNLTASVWLGNGDGTFTEGQSYASIYSDGHASIVDLDGDGNADIFFGLGDGPVFGGDDGFANVAYALMGNGDGTFTGAPAVPTGDYSGNNLANLSTNGPLALITNTGGGSSSTQGAFTVWKSNGKGGFTKGSSISTPDTFTLSGYNFTGASQAGASSFAVADINGDGNADLVFVDNGLTAINPGSGPITYPYPVYFVSLGNGDGTFQTPIPYAFPQIAPAPGFDNTLTVTSLQIADFNKDGHPDLVFFYNDLAGGTGVNPYLQGFVVLTGTGSGTFNATPELTSTYSGSTATTTANLDAVTNVADLNGDGIPDLIVNVPSFSIAAGATTQIQIFLGNGDGTFKAPLPVTISASAFGIPVVADFNKDGKLDLVFITEDSTSQAGFAVALGHGDGTFATPVISDLVGGDAVRSAGLASADFNADGNLDLALFDTAAFSGIFYGNGDGTFTSVPDGDSIVPKDIINLAAGPPAIAIDLNGDGKPDILAANVVFVNIYGSSPTTLASSALSLTASATTISTGTSVTFTAIATAGTGSTATPTGTVTFIDGANALGSATLSSGTATFSTSALAAGTHTITASYGGDATFTGSTSSSVTVTVSSVALVATTTTLTASATTAVTGASLTFNAQVAAASGSTTPSGTVNFTDGGTMIGSGTLNASGTATFATSSLAVGTHTIAAQYTGGASFAASTSNSLTETISAPTPDFAISINPASGSETGSTAATATLTVTPSNGFSSAVNFTCSGLPTGVSCSFNPATITPSGAAATSTVTFSGTATAMNRTAPWRRGAPLLLSLLGMGGVLLAGVRRRHPIFHLFCLLALGLVAIAGMTACGGGSGGSGKGSQTSTVTITASSGTISHTATYSLATTD